MEEQKPNKEATVISSSKIDSIDFQNSLLV